MQTKRKSNYETIMMMMRIEAYVLAPFMALFLYFFVKTGVAMAVIVGVTFFASAHGVMFFIRRHPEKFGSTPREQPSVEQQSEEL